MKNGMKQRLARLLLEKSYIEGEFTLTSGRKSDYYFDCKHTALHPEGAFLLAHLFLSMIRNLSQVEGVGGMTLGADPLVSAVSLLSYIEKYPLPAMIIRKQPKGHGTNQYLEGLKNFAPGSRICMLEDVVTTGGTLLKACQLVQDAGFTVAGVLCVLDREQGGVQNLADAGYELQSIFTREDLLQNAKA